MTLADILQRHWPAYVARCGGPAAIPAAHWRAVEAVLSCRTPRLGGHRHRCGGCGGEHFVFHSCNHRACPRCGGREQQRWAARQRARLLPVPYFMITFTVPAQLRGFFLRHDRIACATLFAAASAAVKDLFAQARHIGGEAGFVAVLHTWTRQMAHQPHLHLVVPAVALAPGGAAVVRPADPEFLLPHAPLARRYRSCFLSLLRERHPGPARELDAQTRRLHWNVNVQRVGSGRTALSYLAAYVGKSAFSESRLAGSDEQGRIRLWWTDSGHGRPQLMTLSAHEFIRRWLLHVLPAGFTRVRHYGFLSGAARKAFRRLRFLLGCGRVRVESLPEAPLRCARCGEALVRQGRIPPARGPPLSRALLFAA